MASERVHVGMCPAWHADMNEPLYNTCLLHKREKEYRVDPSLQTQMC